MVEGKGKGWVSLLLLCMILIMAGCEYGSMNMQRSGLRSGADIGVTAYLDQRKEQDIPASKARVKDGLNKVKELVDSGVMSLGALTNKLSEVFPDKMKGIASAVLNAIDGAHLPIDKIGEKNKDRIRAVLRGGYTALSEYRIQDRPNEDVLPKSP